MANPLGTETPIPDRFVIISPREAFLPQLCLHHSCRVGYTKAPAVTSHCWTSRQSFCDLIPVKKFHDRLQDYPDIFMKLKKTVNRSSKLFFHFSDCSPILLT
ncbi:hypothetical protein FZ928_05920 [Klebsiella pneumoniae]|uniref:Uncharacterized protein n=1 Tax=Klebsiella pneumoniae TaxID=573 RepID=A0A5C2LM57_KLEPN|nr:hypothetical protein FZ928_05920 [Klebsiella pneumoniae]